MLYIFKSLFGNLVFFFSFQVCIFYLLKFLHSESSVISFLSNICIYTIHIFDFSLPFENTITVPSGIYIQHIPSSTSSCILRKCINIHLMWVKFLIYHCNFIIKFICTNFSIFHYSLASFLHQIHTIIYEKATKNISISLSFLLLSLRISFWD